MNSPIVQIVYIGKPGYAIELVALHGDGELSYIRILPACGYGMRVTPIQLPPEEAH